MGLWLHKQEMITQNVSEEDIMSFKGTDTIIYKYHEVIFHEMSSEVGDINLEFL